MEPAPSRGGRLPPAWALGTYALLALGLTWRAWWSGAASTLVQIDQPDWTGTAWTWWWTARALVHGQDPFDCALAYYPVGLYPVAQYNILDAVLAAPFVALLGVRKGIDAAVAAILATNGAAAHTLARWEGADRTSALFAGVALESSSFLAGEVYAGRVSQVLLAFLVLALGLWLRLLRGEGARKLAVAAGTASALTFLAYWYYGLFLAFAVAACLPLLWRADRARLGRVALGAATTLVLVLPFVLLLLGRASTLPGMTESEGWTDHGAAGRGEAGLNWAIMASLEPWWPLYPSAAARIDATLPVVLLLAAFAPLVAYRRGRWPWLAVALVGWVLALGPYLRDAAGLPQPGASLPWLWLYDHLPFFRRLWWPYRAAALLHVAAVALAALNLSEMRREGGAAVTVLALALAPALLVESVLRSPVLPYPASPTMELSPAWTRATGPLLVLPVSSNDATSRQALWLQTLHGQPISTGIGAHIRGHRPAAVDALVQGNDLLRALAAIEAGPPERLAVSRQAVADLVALGFRYVVLDGTLYAPTRQAVAEELLAPTLTALLGPPVAEDGRTRVWALEPPAADLQVELSPGAEGAP